MKNKNNVWICPDPNCQCEIDIDMFKGRCPICGYEPATETSHPKEIGEIYSLTPSVSKKQLGILILDGSGSMENKTQELISKNAAVGKSVTELFQIFKTSTRKHRYCFAVVDFDEIAHRKLDITEINDINILDDFKPIQRKDKCTYLYTGLEEAEKIADKFLNTDDKYRSVVMVIMTDGLDMNMEKAKSTASRLKEKYGGKIKITASCFIARDLSDNDKQKVMEFLRTIVTSEEELCMETATAQELRDFFYKSVTQTID